MISAKPKRADLVKEICLVTQMECTNPTHLSNGQLRELILWVRQARKIIAEIAGGNKDASD